MKIEIVTCESGDWEILKLNGEEFASGHSLSNYDWESLLKEALSIEVEHAEISDEEMEKLC